MLSGYGVVSKEITDEDLLSAWHEVLKKWHQNLSQKPKQVTQLVKKGIPEALRGEVWQLLAGCHESSELLEAYRVLITKVTLMSVSKEIFDDRWMIVLRTENLYQNFINRR